MAAEYQGYWARKPRYAGNQSHRLEVRLERPADPAPAPAAELVDLSRSGMQLRASAPVATGESIVVRLRDVESGVDLSLPATVRSLAPERPGAWRVGCRFTREVPLETLGELFLNDILMPQAEPPSGQE